MTWAEFLTNLRQDGFPNIHTKDGKIAWGEFLELYEGWVSASDLLPPEEVFVLTVGMVGGNAETWRVAYRRGDSWFLQTQGQTLKIRTVTHWQALPQPPEQIVLE